MKVLKISLNGIQIIIKKEAYKLYKSQLPKLNNCNVGVIGLGYVGLPLALKIANQKKCLK